MTTRRIPAERVAQLTAGHPSALAVERTIEQLNRAESFASREIAAIRERLDQIEAGLNEVHHVDHLAAGTCARDAADLAANLGRRTDAWQMLGLLLTDDETQALAAWVAGEPQA